MSSINRWIFIANFICSFVCLLENEFHNFYLKYTYQSSHHSNEFTLKTKYTRPSLYYAIALQVWHFAWDVFALWYFIVLVIPHKQVWTSLYWQTKPYDLFKVNMLWPQREIRLPLAHHNQVNCGLPQTYNRNREHEFLFLGPVCVVQLYMLENVKESLVCAKNQVVQCIYS